jgi:hypothetical protein
MALLGLACVLVPAGGFDLVTRWKDSQARKQICRDWNADNSDEQFYVSGLDNSRIHVVVHGALAADADEIFDGLTNTPGFIHELLKDGFVSVECGGRTVNLHRRAPKSVSTHRERRAGSSHTGNQEV